MSRHRNISLFVRHIHERARQDELRAMFDRYGPVRDVYIPLDYYTRAPRGFAYVEYEDDRDAEDALHGLQGAKYMGRTIELEFAKGDRRTPGEMRGRYGSSGGRDYDRSPRRRRSRSRSHDRHRRRRSRSRSRSRSPRRRSKRSPTRSRSRSRSNSKSQSRSVSREYNGGESDRAPSKEKSASPEPRNGNDQTSD